jgi:hypothetical protein
MTTRDKQAKGAVGALEVVVAFFGIISAVVAFADANVAVGFIVLILGFLPMMRR